MASILESFNQLVSTLGFRVFAFAVFLIVIMFRLAYGHIDNIYLLFISIGIAFVAGVVYFLLKTRQERSQHVSIRHTNLRHVILSTITRTMFVCYIYLTNKGTITIDTLVATCRPATNNFNLVVNQILLNGRFKSLRFYRVVNPAQCLHIYLYILMS